MGIFCRNVWLIFYICKIYRLRSLYFFSRKTFQNLTQIRMKMQNSNSSTSLQAAASIHKKFPSNKKFITQKLPKNSSFVNLSIKIQQQHKRPTVHLQALTKKSTKTKLYLKRGQKQQEICKPNLSFIEKNKVYITENTSIQTQNKSLFIPLQMENLNFQTPLSQVHSQGLNRKNTPVVNKRRFCISKKVQREKENSFLIKKSSPSIKRDLNLSFKQFSISKEDLFVERRNFQKEELYYVDELKRQLDKIQQSNVDLNQNISSIIGHFLQSITTFFKYKDLKKPRQQKINIYLEKPKKKTTLIFDMDQTLIHAQPFKKQLHQNSWGSNIQIKMEDGLKMIINLKIRPHMVEVLRRLKKKYEIGVFTAGTETYASQILKKIDPNEEIFDFQLYRQYCDLTDGKLTVKDLRILKNRSLKNVILIDNSPHTYLYQKQNAIPILSFFDNESDQEMLKLEDFLQEKAFHKQEDVREILDEVFKLRKYTDFGSLQQLLEELY